MKKLFILAALLLLPTLAQAQSQRNPCYYIGTSGTGCVSVTTTTPLPVVGTFTPSANQTVNIDQTTPGTTNGVQVNAALPAGSNIIGKTSIDQTTPGTTNGVQVNAALPAGTNLIGKFGIDQTTPGTTNLVSIGTNGTVNPTTAANWGLAATSAAVPANAMYVGMAQSGNLTGLTGTSGNLNVQCANCSGSGVSTIDAATFTASSSLFAGTGGFYQTTATNNPLTDGKQGMWQMTATRAGFVNLRNAAGTEIGTATTPVQVSLANTAANATAIKVDGTGGAFPATQSGTWNITNVSGTVSLPTGAATATNQTTAVAAKGEGATGSAVPSGGIYVGANSGGNLTGLIQADSSAAISVSSATTTQIVALSSTKKIYVTSLDVIAGGTGNITFVYGTGSACGTGTTSLTGAYNLTAQAGLAKGNGLGPVLVVPASNALCVTTSAAVQMSGSVAYTQF